MNRSLDFTACDLPCKHPCWRRLTEEEREWLETHPNRQYYTTVCVGKTNKEKKKGFDLRKINMAQLFQMEDDFMEMEDDVN